MSNMKYEYERIAEHIVTEPSLTQMTENAIQVLERCEHGYFLLVEGIEQCHLEFTLC